MGCLRSCTCVPAVPGFDELRGGEHDPLFSFSALHLAMDVKAQADRVNLTSSLLHLIPFLFALLPHFF